MTTKDQERREQDLRDLLNRLNSATKGSMTLSDEIFELRFNRKRRRSPFPMEEDGETLIEYTTSTDAALTVAAGPDYREWPDILRKAISHLSKKYGWHCTFPKPDSKDELPIAILRIHLRMLLGERLYDM